MIYTLNLEAYYMNPTTGSVDTGAGWLADSEDWEGDIDAQLRSLIEVVAITLRSGATEYREAGDYLDAQGSYEPDAIDEARDDWPTLDL